MSDIESIDGTITLEDGTKVSFSIDPDDGGYSQWVLPPASSAPPPTSWMPWALPYATLSTTSRRTMTTTLDYIHDTAKDWATRESQRIDLEGIVRDELSDEQVVARIRVGNSDTILVTLVAADDEQVRVFLTSTHDGYNRTAKNFSGYRSIDDLDQLFEDLLDID